MAVALAPRLDMEIRPYLDSLGLPGIIDLHVHFMPSQVLEKVWAFFDRVADSGAPAWPITYRASEEERVRILRDMGVKAFTTLNYAHRPGMAQWLNDYSAAFALSHADAIHSATFYPEPDVENVVRQSLKQGARIFKVHIQVGGFSPLDPQLAPAWKLIEDSAAPVVIHCGNGPHAGEYTGLEPIRELIRRYPALVLIIAHAGLPEYREFAELAANNPHVYLDTTMVGTSYMEQVAPIPPGYVDILAGLSHKVVFGTDFPSIPYSYSHQIQVLESWGLGSRWMKNALWHTPRALLRLDQLP
ncbi:amidohydrolase [Arthrobacter sp. FW306-05-C]|uniref:amidohydrolase family protein n=1 Tax=Arthrobacter sp. FW306-05-C TaxID=2879620 RepID=UPI001F2879C6|nr:amidohydrolase family protein [Arthrobacter sp. FW306-05-C]UKA68553.1 amidohydrolase [Arthrobacter sp. FW306-05-C]